MPFCSIFPLCVGSGSFGNVFLAMNLRDKFLLAVKQIQVRHDNEPSLRAMIDEVEILQKLNHPSLIKYFGVEVHKVREKCLMKI
jgi:serine/threonine protein kinase